MWDFKSPRWEADILGRGNGGSQAWVKSPVPSRRQGSRAGTRRDALQSSAPGRERKALEAKAKWKLNFFLKRKEYQSRGFQKISVEAGWGRTKWGEARGDQRGLPKVWAQGAEKDVLNFRENSHTPQIRKSECGRGLGRFNA